MSTSVRADISGSGSPIWKVGTYSWPRPMYWTADSPINAPIPVNPVLDSESNAIMAAIAAGSSKAIAVTDYGTPIRVARPDTPRWTIVPSQTGNWGDGLNPFRDVNPIPIDMSWTTIPLAASPSGDGHLSVIDAEKGLMYDLWDCDLSGPAPTCQWGGVAYPTTSTITTSPGHATAAAFGRSAGVIREEEIARGYIDHALVFSSDICRVATYRFPATHTDGKNLRGSAATIVQGSRIQMDPAIDVAAQSWPTYVKIVAKALQTYGAYCIDNGGAALSIGAQLPDTAYFANGSWKTGSAIYAAAGLTETNRSIAVLPWSTGFRVLANWNGA